MRATDATGHKIASAYGYATRHTKPQGFIIRPPLLTTNKVLLIQASLLIQRLLEFYFWNRLVLLLVHIRVQL
jgi:hypothetical protein